MDVALDERTRFVIGEQIRSKIDPLRSFIFVSVRATIVLRRWASAVSSPFALRIDWVSDRGLGAAAGAVLAAAGWKNERMSGIS